MRPAAVVSVVTIFRDARPFLAEAVDSVLAQTHPDWELVLVDDGSADGSDRLARRYAAAHARVRCVAHPGRANRGMSAARNLGVHHARGRLLAFLDADDVWLPTTLARLTAALAAHPAAGMVVGRTEWWFGWTGRPEDAARDHLPATGLPPDTVLEPPALLLRCLRDETRSPGTCSVLVRREAFDAVDGFEEGFRGMYEDQAFFAKVGCTVPVLLTGERVARYRQHPDSCYARARGRGEADAAERRYLRWLARWLATHRAAARGADWDALRAILRPHRRPLLHRLARRLGGLARYALRSAT